MRGACAGDALSHTETLRDKCSLTVRSDSLVFSGHSSLSSHSGSLVNRVMAEFLDSDGLCVHPSELSAELAVTLVTR